MGRSVSRSASLRAGEDESFEDVATDDGRDIKVEATITDHLAEDDENVQVLESDDRRRTGPRPLAPSSSASLEAARRGSSRKADSPTSTGPVSLSASDQRLVREFLKREIFDRSPNPTDIINFSGEKLNHWRLWKDGICDELTSVGCRCPYGWDYGAIGSSQYNSAPFSFIDRVFQKLEVTYPIFDRVAYGGCVRHQIRADCVEEQAFLCEWRPFFPGVVEGIGNERQFGVCTTRTTLPEGKRELATLSRNGNLEKLLKLAKRNQDKGADARKRLFEHPDFDDQLWQNATRRLYPLVGTPAASDHDHNHLAGLESQSLFLAPTYNEALDPPHPMTCVIYSLIPFVYGFFLLVRLLLRRSAKTFLDVAFPLIVAVVINKAIVKKIWQQERPAESCGIDYGMPSSHAMVSLGLLVMKTLQLMYSAQLMEKEVDYKCPPSPPYARAVERLNSLEDEEMKMSVLLPSSSTSAEDTSSPARRGRKNNRDPAPKNKNKNKPKKEKTHADRTSCCGVFSALCNGPIWFCFCQIKRVVLNHVGFGVRGPHHEQEVLITRMEAAMWLSIHVIWLVPVGPCRVILRDHTLQQILIGGAVGSKLGWAWVGLGRYVAARTTRWLGARCCCFENDLHPDFLPFREEVLQELERAAAARREAAGGAVDKTAAATAEVDDSAAVVDDSDTTSRRSARLQGGSEVGADKSHISGARPVVAAVGEEDAEKERRERMKIVADLHIVRPVHWFYVQRRKALIVAEFEDINVQERRRKLLEVMELQERIVEWAGAASWSALYTEMKNEQTLNGEAGEEKGGKAEHSEEVSS
eukprot:g11600.t1